MVLRVANKLSRTTRKTFMRVVFASTDTHQADAYSNLNVKIQATYFQGLISRINVKEGWQCLDIGCGPGNNTYTLSKMVGDKGSVLAIDPDEERLKKARENFHAPNIKYISGKSTEFPVINDGYDLVISNTVMHWVSYLERVETYRRVFQALKKGGLCAVVEVASLPFNMTALVAFMHEHERKFVIGNSNFLTVDENKKIFADSSFEILQAEHEFSSSTHDGVNVFLNWFAATYHGNINTHEAYSKSDVILEMNKQGLITLPVGLNFIVAKKPS